MSNITLSLRQRKLLNCIQHQSTYVTGEYLSNILNVSSRTIRSDVVQINKLLASLGIQIYSKRSLGYMLQIDNTENLKFLNSLTNSFLSREDRIRYICFSLCLSDDPINLYDLETEMFVSHTTLDYDLSLLTKKYSDSYPYIKLIRSKNNISFEATERKRRALLNHLFSQNWNYNSKGNIYYQYEYISEDIINIITKETNFYMKQYNIIMEDINIVILNIAIAIMHFRIINGYEITDIKPLIYKNSTAIHATEDLLNSLEDKLNCTFCEAERNEIYLHVCCSTVIHSDKINIATINSYFDSSVIKFTNRYIEKIRDVFRIDFKNDNDFYITLLEYLSYLSLPIHHLNEIDSNAYLVKSNLLAEFEFAYLIQPYAFEFYGRYLNYTELLYLAFCISGAILGKIRKSPKLKTIIMSHLNMPCTWNLKQNLLNNFSQYIDVISLLPINVKDYYDFSQIDLIITTVNKEISLSKNCKTICISPVFTSMDEINLQNYIVQNQFDQLYPSSLPDINDLIVDAFWHENIKYTEFMEIIKLLASDFIDNTLVPTEYLSDIINRESILSFATNPNIALVYTLTPSTKTCLSIATLEHRIKWNSYKIRTIIMIALRPCDISLIFKLLTAFYSVIQLDDLAFISTREDFINYFKNN